MKKTLVGLFTLVALAVGIQASQAACPCQNPCPSCSPAAPCCSTPCDPCDQCAQATPCCPTTCNTGCRKKCTWWKIFEDKTCCDKCSNQCAGGCTAKRAHWYAFWTDRCVVSTPKCNKCDPCCN